MVIIGVVMKKKALVQDFKIEVKKSITRFLSILLIVALGVAFYSGIRASKPDMKLSADKYYDDTGMMDVRVISTMGLTGEDVAAISRVKGIKDAEPSYSVDLLCNTKDAELVVKVMSLTDRLNKINVMNGRLPKEADECLADPQFLEDTGYKIGDTIEFRSGTKENLDKSLSISKFTIVGVGNSSSYLSFERGNSSIGNGKINSFIIVPGAAFALEAYTEIYASVTGAKELTSYTDEYEDTVLAVVNNVKAIADTQAKARYDEILKDPQKEIEDAKAKLTESEADTDKKLADAAKKIEDGKNKIKDGEDKLAEGKEELENGKTELNRNKEKLRTTEADLKAGEEKLNASETQLNSGKEELIKKRQEYNTGAASLASGYKEWNTSMDSWNAGNNELVKNETTVNKALNDVKQQKAELEPVKDLHAEQWQQLLTTEGSLLKQQGELKAGRKKLDNSKKELNTAKITLDQKQKEVKAADKALTREEQKVKAAESTIVEKRGEIEKGKKEIASGWNEISKAEEKIGKNEKLLKDKEKELTEAKTTLKEKEKDYNEGAKTADKEIDDAKLKIKDAEDKLSEVDYPKWYVLDRNSIQTYAEYGQDSERIGNIGKVFPVIFFLVAALVSLTTMTRMVEEQRTQIGTLKALGYSKRAIAGKYIWYSLLTSLIGSIIGVLIGEQILPKVIITAYAILYKSLPQVLSPYNIYYGATSALIAVACTTLAAFFSCYKELMSTPAKLMRPAAPKLGKRVILERIPWVWKHLNFTSKATVRNLLRYKKRFFMTVFGIGGCMSLLLVGFGLRDSIGAMSDIQYVDIWHQDATVTVKDDITEQENDGLLKELQKDDKIAGAAAVLDITVDAGNDKLTKSTSLVVPKDTKTISEYIVFRNRITYKPAVLKDDGVIITEKLASLSKLSIGDTILIKDGDTKSVEAKVTDIVENYMFHYIFMTPGLYEKLYGKAPEYNRIYIKQPDSISIDEKSFASELLNHDKVTAISFTSDFQNRINDMLNSLNLVIYVLIISAGLLAFIVLYNLNNINITERKRELATLKVLGFQDMEVAAYVYRENIMLTVIGSLAGIIMGIALHRLVILTTEIDNIMFGRTIKSLSFLYSILLTLGFSAFVNYVMFYKLRKIDMVESLKSVE
jgi:putative ABC transport system permease protein